MHSRATVAVIPAGTRVAVRRAGKDVLMLIPVVIFVACLVAGVVGAAQWLPDLAVGSQTGRPRRVNPRR
jgi:hypothetical protein